MFVFLLRVEGIDLESLNIGLGAVLEYGCVSGSLLYWLKGPIAAQKHWEELRPAGGASQGPSHHLENTCPLALLIRPFLEGGGRSSRVYLVSVTGFKNTEKTVEAQSPVSVCGED